MFMPLTILGRWRKASRRSVLSGSTKGTKTRLFGPIALNGEKYLIRVGVSTRWRNRGPSEVVVINTACTPVADASVATLVVETSVLAGLITRRKCNYSRNIQGSLAHINEGFRCFDGMTDESRLGMSVRDELVKNIKALNSMAMELHGIVEVVSGLNVPSYESIASFDRVCDELRREYLYLVDNCELLFKHEEAEYMSLASDDRKHWERSKSLIQFHLNMLRVIIKKLIGLANERDEYVKLLTSRKSASLS